MEYDSTSQLYHFYGNIGATGTVYISPFEQFYANHRYLIYSPKYGNVSPYLTTSIGFLRDSGGTIYKYIQWSENIDFYVCTADTQLRVGIAASQGVDFDIHFQILIFDLTLMFGYDKEPSTFLDFVQRLGYYDINTFPWYLPYTKGTIENLDRLQIKTQSPNVWNEKWEVGQWGSNGSKSDTGICIRSTDKIMVQPNTNYYIKSDAQNIVVICYYDRQGIFISRNGDTRTNTTFTTPSNCFYITFNSAASYGTIYNNDICINKSSIPFNGLYSPYWVKLSIPIDFTSLKGYDINGGSEEVLIFLDGFKSAGEAHDEILLSGDSLYAIKRINQINLGVPTWSKTVANPNQPTRNGFEAIIPNIFIPSTNTERNKKIVSTKFTPAKPNLEAGGINLSYGGNSLTYNYEMATAVNKLFVRYDEYTDASEFQNAMNGIYLNYEISTPIIYKITNRKLLPYLYNIAAGGSEELDGSEMLAFKGEIVYRK